MSLYRIEIDRYLCVGYGACAELAPDVFVLEGGVASIRTGTSSDPAVAEAADLCPMSAIAVRREEAA
jgi:ferredoxin